MCRLAVFRGIDDALTLAWAFAQLELSYGGHGNGVYLGKQDKIIKGTDADIVTLAKEAAGEDGFCIFHTRLASCGGIKDELCHPFRVKGEAGEFVVAHNGHWGAWNAYRFEDESSDTQTMANLVGKYGLGVLLARDTDHSGVWTVFDVAEQKMFVVRRTGEFKLQRLDLTAPNEPSAFFHASEPIIAYENFTRSCVTPSFDVAYEIGIGGKARERRNIEAVTPERKPGYVGFTTGGYQFTGYGTGSEWDEYDNTSWRRDPRWKGEWIHDTAYDIETHESWQCYCKKDYVCGKCDVYLKLNGWLPVYDDEYDEIMDELNEAADYEKRMQQGEIDAQKETGLAVVHRFPTGNDLGRRDWDCLEPGCDRRTQAMYCVEHRLEEPGGEAERAFYEVAECGICCEEILVEKGTGAGYICTWCRLELIEMEGYAVERFAQEGASDFVDPKATDAEVVDAEVEEAEVEDVSFISRALDGRPVPYAPFVNMFGHGLGYPFE